MDIYKSPDGGKTIYSRKPTSIERTLIKSPTLIESIRDNMLWGNIRRAAKDNPTLLKSLEQCIIIYMLSKDYEERYGNR